MCGPFLVVWCRLADPCVTVADLEVQPMFEAWPGLGPTTSPSPAKMVPSHRTNSGG